jgi:hypothetical protein
LNEPCSLHALSWNTHCSTVVRKTLFTHHVGCHQFCHLLTPQ